MRGQSFYALLLTIAPEESLVVIFATTRSTNELIRLGKARQAPQPDAYRDYGCALCPLIPFADLSINRALAPHPLIGSPTTLSCLINFFVVELAAAAGADL